MPSPEHVLSQMELRRLVAFMTIYTATGPIAELSERQQHHLIFYRWLAYTGRLHGDSPFYR